MNKSGDLLLKEENWHETVYGSDLILTKVETNVLPPPD